MGILLVYSVTDKGSFNSVEIWMRQIRQFAVENIPILILSNKADVEFKEVSEQQSRALSERHNVDLLVTSAKKNINIEAAMVRLYHKIDKEKKVSATNSTIH
jgi:GTPase SAR1 family protein